MYSRIDRNFVKSIGALNEHLTEADRRITKDLYVFIAYAFQYPCLQETLFGAKILLPKTFAEVMGYTKSYVVNMHPAPTQQQGKSIEELEELLALDKTGEKPAWKTVLDNALYLLNYSFLEYSSGAKIKEDNLSYSTLHELRVFKADTVKKFYHSGWRQIYYEYQEHPNFINNLAHYFFYFDFDLYRKLSNKEKDAYLLLIQWRTHENVKRYKETRKSSFEPIVVYSITFNQLRDALKLHRADGAFAQEKSAMKKLLTSINKKAGYQFVTIDFTSGPYSQWLSCPILTFPFSQQEIAFIEKEKSQRITQFLLYNLKQHFRKRSQETGTSFINLYQFEDQFKRYLTDQSRDEQGKMSIVQETLKQCTRRDVEEQTTYKWFNIIPQLQLPTIKA